MTAAFEPRIVDPTVNPDAANEIVKRLTGPGSDIPLMKDPPTNVVILPGGYIDADGALHREVRVREINGADEEVLARELRVPTLNIPRVVDIILKRCVEAVGTIDPVTPMVLTSMLTGDRSFLMLSIRILTFGNDWEVPDFPCRFCGETFGTIVELNSIPLKELDNHRVQDIEVPLRHDHTATVALMNGAVQLEMTAEDRTAAEQQTIAIDRCLRAIDGQPPAGPVALRMGMADRRKIIEALADGQPGPRMEEVGVQCTKCGREGDYTLSLIDLFR
jgi:hypothetical protein